MSAPTTITDRTAAALGLRERVECAGCSVCAALRAELARAREEAARLRVAYDDTRSEAARLCADF